MGKKQQTQKRRVAAAEQVARQQAAAAKADRRRRMIVGGIVGFLALALIAPLTAGLIASSDPEEPPVTTTSVFDLPWTSADRAGATILGATPCPATDGSAVRTTEFAEAPPVCIDDGAAYELTFETEAGSFTLPVDSTIDATVANLVAVMGWYRSYEQTPITAASGGLMLVGSGGDAGFTIPIAPPSDPIDELYPVGSVVALPGIDGGITGALVVVLEESGSLLIRSDPRYIPVGMIEDLSSHQAVYDSADPDEFLLIDTVTVEQAN